MALKYKRILLKISGEALGGEKGIWTGRISGTLARLNARNQKGRGDMRNSLVYGKCKKHCRTKS